MSKVVSTSLILLSLLATLYISLCLLLRWRQTKLIFFPDSYIESTPQDYGLDYQDVWLSLGEERVHGWWIPAAQVSTPTLLYFHGNGSNNAGQTHLNQKKKAVTMNLLKSTYQIS